jgi:two-component system OmpR family sensor kinase
MNRRRITWLGVSISVVGVIVALVMRLMDTSPLIAFHFVIDPAVIVLLLALCLSTIILVANLISYRQHLRTEKALVDLHDSLEEERRRFIHRLDHEMKNPLTAIQVQLDNLQSSEALDFAVVEGVRKQVERLIALLRGLRRLTDLETRTLEVEEIDVEELLDEVVELLQAPERIQLDVQHIPWSVPPIHGDRELLLVAFRNLVHNGLRYSNGVIQVRARHTAGHLVVEIIDTGRGIAAEELPLVTEELYRGTNVHDLPGSGLGLSLVKIIVERHGGQLELRSRPDKGTIATVQIPYEQT